MLEFCLIEISVSETNFCSFTNVIILVLDLPIWRRYYLGPTDRSILIGYKYHHLPVRRRTLMYWLSLPSAFADIDNIMEVRTHRTRWGYTATLGVCFRSWWSVLIGLVTENRLSTTLYSYCLGDTYFTAYFLTLREGNNWITQSIN